MDGGALTVGWVALAGIASTVVGFMLGFCVKSRLYERQVDELIVVIKRPTTFAPPPAAYTAI